MAIGPGRALVISRIDRIIQVDSPTLISRHVFQLHNILMGIHFLLVEPLRVEFMRTDRIHLFTRGAFLYEWLIHGIIRSSYFLYGRSLLLALKNDSRSLFLIGKFKINFSSGNSRTHLWFFRITDNIFNWLIFHR